VAEAVEVGVGVGEGWVGSQQALGAPVSVHVADIAHLM
jgi:hypothetical protein